MYLSNPFLGSLINCVILIFWFDGNSMEVGFRFELFLLILSIGVWLRFCRDSVLCGADDVYNGCVHSVFLHNQICFRIFVWQWDFVLHSWKIKDRVSLTSTSPSSSYFFIAVFLFILIFVFLLVCFLLFFYSMEALTTSILGKFLSSLFFFFLISFYA